MTSLHRYLEGEALSAAVDWLHAHNLPTGGDTTPANIEEHYPGGLHFFIAEHLVQPPETLPKDDGAGTDQWTLF